MKATLTFEGKTFPVEIGDSFVAHLNGPQGYAEKVGYWATNAKPTDRLMFGRRTENGLFVPDADIQAAIVADCKELLYALGIESTGDGNYVPIFDRLTAENMFDDYVQENISIDDIVVNIGSYHSKQYTIYSYDVNLDWVEAFRESSDYGYARDEWIEDKCDEFAVLGSSCYSVSSGQPYTLDFPDSSSDDWTPIEDEVVHV